MTVKIGAENGRTRRRGCATQNGGLLPWRLPGITREVMDVIDAPVGIHTR